MIFNGLGVRVEGKIFKEKKVNFVMGFFKDTKGYPRNKSTGKLIHRSVAEKKIGRPLREHEIVHHKDGDKGNFSKKNLRVTSRAHHSKLHKKYKY